MAYYGIPSAGLALTASTANDKISLEGLGGTLVTAQSVYGAEGNDVINLGALGITATASALIKAPALGFATGSGNGGAISGTHVVSGEVYLDASADAAYSDTTGVAYGVSGTSFTMAVSAVGVVTSQQAARTINGALFQANAGNDSIALGDSLSRVSAATFAGGAGNDLIGGFTYVNEQWTAAAIAGTVVSTNFEGGNGNDTIELSGGATYSAININANKDDDLVSLDGSVTDLGNSIVGLGAGNDAFSGELTLVDTSTIAGGKGNDVIQLSATNANFLVIGGDRANASNLAGDGHDSIKLDGTTYSASTIYGGGGNDTVTFSAAMSASEVSMNLGQDKFIVMSGQSIDDSTIGLGNQGDIFEITGANVTEVLSSRINLGKGLDTTDFGDSDVASSTMFGSTTLDGGAGADYLLGSATLTGGGTVAINLFYDDNADSTITAFDTVALDVTDNQSGNYVFRYEDGASLATFSAAGVTGTNGVVAFSSSYQHAVTARAEVIAANTTAGDAAVFLDGSSNSYLFVKGSTDDLIVQIGSAAVTGINSFNINASKNFTIGIER